MLVHVAAAAPRRVQREFPDNLTVGDQRGRLSGKLA